MAFPKAAANPFTRLYDYDQNNKIRDERDAEERSYFERVHLF